MKTTITARTLAELVQALLINPDSVGELDTLDKHRQFVTDIARVVAEHCGGEVPNDAFVTAQHVSVDVVPNDSLPEGGGIWQNHSGDVVNGIPADQLRVSTYPTGSAWKQGNIGVRIEHVPTGVVAECAEDRSAHRNRALALAQLSASRVVIASLADSGQEHNMKPTSVEVVELLLKARRYVAGAYECAFPDEDENNDVLSQLDELVTRLR